MSQPPLVLLFYEYTIQLKMIKSFGYVLLILLLLAN